jgi:hypothetical protein
VTAYISVFVEGFRRLMGVRGTFWLLNERLIFKRPAA